MRRHEKTMRARSLETLHDSSLCKVIQRTYDANVACRMLQIDLQRWFRMGIRQLRENARAESPCSYGCPERMIHKIIDFVGEGGSSTEHTRGRLLRHDDQLHFAEWQALHEI